MASLLGEDFMRHRLWLLGLLAAGCNPYHNLDGDFYLGPVDAEKFQAAYLGQGFDPSSNAGTIVPSYAGIAGGDVIAYYAFPAGPDALVIDKVGGGSRAPVYIFDGDSATDSDKCQKPSADYSYDVQRDFVRFDRQFNVFEDDSPAPPLPDDPAYVPIYAEVPVTSNGEGCQSIHSAEGLVSNAGVTLKKGDRPSDENAHAVGIADGKYLALAAIDPRATVLFADGTVNDSTGLGAGRFAWFNHMLLEYVEGGVVPTVQAAIPDPNGGPDQMVIAAQTATLFVPNALVDAMGMPVCAGLDCLGQGADLLVGTGGDSGVRGDAGYSPICSVRTFTPVDPAAPPLDPADVDPASLDPDDGTLVYCLQLAQ
jgi:hypothetical protein